MIQTFWLVLGYPCNNRCPHCYAQFTGFTGEWMDLEYAKKVMVTMKRGGVTNCILIGGEPSLYPHILEVIAFGAEIGLEMIIISNGRRMSYRPFTESIFKVGLSRAVISLLGASEDTHNLLTGCNSMKTTTRGIQVCAEFGRVNTLTTISQGNYLEIADTIRLAYKLGARHAVLNCAIPAVSPETLSAEQSLTPAEFAQVVDATFRELEPENLPFYLNATFPLCLLPKETASKLLERRWLSIGCHMYHGEGVVFEATGDILPCTHFAGMPLLKSPKNRQGKLTLNARFWKSWRAPHGTAGQFRTALWQYPAKRCEGCEYWGACIGGCPLLWVKFNPEKFIQKGGDLQ